MKAFEPPTGATFHNQRGNALCIRCIREVMRAVPMLGSESTHFRLLPLLVGSTSTDAPSLVHGLHVQAGNASRPRPCGTVLDRNTTFLFLRPGRDLPTSHDSVRGFAR